MASHELLKILKAHHDVNHILPPYAGDACEKINRSPYDISILDFVEMYSYTQDRIVILDGLLKYRKALSLVIPDDTHGFQWLAGSFIESIENTEQRSPNDIDVVTSIYLSQVDQIKAATHENLFDVIKSKKDFKVDCHFIDLNTPQYYIINDTAYWFGLFGHKRNQQWKGFYRVPLYDEIYDKQAENILRGRP